MEPKDYKDIVKNNLSLIKEKTNLLLSGDLLNDIEMTLARIDKKQVLPHWYSVLKEEKRLPNLDGKTVGSIIEKLLVCVLEVYIFNREIELSLSPARGVDIPEIELGIKSPSTNFCTSEPFFSAYERLLGNEYDSLVLLTNYQEAKSHTPFILKITDARYLYGSEIADKNICVLAKKCRESFEDPIQLQKVYRFLAYINQSDWEAQALLKLLKLIEKTTETIDAGIDSCKLKFLKDNRKNEIHNQESLSQEIIDRILDIKGITPRSMGIINAVENWVIMKQKDNGRFPNENELRRLMVSSLNGKIGMSFALQWRYNFRPLFD